VVGGIRPQSISINTRDQRPPPITAISDGHSFSRQLTIPNLLSTHEIRIRPKQYILAIVFKKNHLSSIYQEFHLHNHVLLDNFGSQPEYAKPNLSMVESDQVKKKDHHQNK